MTDEKTRRPPAGKPGGDKPMRRKPASGARPPAGDRKPPFAARGDKPKFDRPKFDKPRVDRPRVDKPRFEKSARPAPDAARAERPQKKLRPERQDPTPRTSTFEGERISKVMARAGVCSRRDAEKWIEEGRVSVNGRVLTTPAVNVRDSDKIEIDGAPMQARERTRLFLFHKPPGLVTTARDDEGRPTVFAFLAERYPDLPRLVSVGRLDINTEGLLLLTNDGGLARTLELPATGWTRRYRVRAHGEIDQARLDALREGVTVEGVDYAPIEAKLERVQGANCWIAMSLTEGKNREVKRVMAHLGLDVARLFRVSYGPFQLGDLEEGAVEEVRLKTLREQLGKGLAELAGVDFGAPLREPTPAEAQEKRERIEKRPRKHVSVLRKERDEESESRPRARIARGATADRKGRAVAVERVTLVRPRRDDDESAPPSRNAKRFAAERGRERLSDGRRGPDARRDDRRTTSERSTPRFDRSRGDETRRDKPPRERRDAFAPGARSGPKRFEGRKGERVRDEAPRRPTREFGARTERTNATRDSAREFDRPRDGSRQDARSAAPRGDARAARPSSPPRDGARKFERPRDDFRASKPRAPRDRQEGDIRQPRHERGEGASPRGPRKGPSSGTRSGAPGGRHKGPPRKGPAHKGPPRRGPHKGPPGKGGPRKPRT